jgi:hypothetical protein
MSREILEVDLMKITKGLKNRKDHLEDLNLKKMSLKKTIWKIDLAEEMFQELSLLLQ